MPPARESRIEHDNVIADRRQVAGDRQRRRPRSDTRDSLAVARRRRLRQKSFDVLLPVGGDPLQPADGDRLLLQSPPPAGGLARPVAGAAQDARKDVRLPVDQIGAVVVALRDPANIFRDGRVSRAGPLAVDNLMEIVGIGDIGRLHFSLSSPPPPRRELFRPLLNTAWRKNVQKLHLKSTQARDLVYFHARLAPLEREPVGRMTESGLVRPSFFAPFGIDSPPLPCIRADRGAGDDYGQAAYVV